MFRCDGEVWTQHDVRDGLAGNLIGGILQARDGTVWVSTDAGISRHDGRTWSTQALPRGLGVGTSQRGLRLGETEDGALWISHAKGTTLLTTRYKPDTTSPKTEITLSTQ